MVAPSNEELVALEKFRKAIQAEDIKLHERQQHDMALITWLRARELNIPKATEMLRKSCEWRIAQDVDDILNWKIPDSYPKRFPYEICGKSIDDCPIMVVPFGKFDVRKCVEAGEKSLWLRYVLRGSAILYKDMNKTNDSRKPDSGLTPVSQCIIIMDFEGFGIRQLTSISCVQTLIDFINRFENNFPELLSVAYLINAPRAFSILLSIVKPVLSMRTLSKIEIYTSNPNKWKPAILKYIKPDQLPIALGGTNPNTCKFFSKGYIYAAESQIELNENENDGIDNFITTTIGAGQDFKLEYDITKENTTIGWSFKTDFYNIGFSILYNINDEIFLYKKYDSHIVKQNGFVNCQKLGTYTIVFDNKFSKLREKTVHYTICIDEPEE